MKTLEAKMKKLGAARRSKVEARAAQLIADEMSLSDLRRAHKLTQATVAKALDVNQDQISRIEKRSDLLLSTLRKYIEGLGGTLTWSKYGKRYERQGILVEPEALDRAVAESDADADVRAARAARSAVRRDLHDREYVDAFAKAIRAQYPGAPAGAETAIAEHACRKYSGRVGRSAMAKDFDELAIFLAVRAHVRHCHTDYDAQLFRHDDRPEARASVRDRIESVLDAWGRES